GEVDIPAAAIRRVVLNGTAEAQHAALLDLAGRARNIEIAELALAARRTIPVWIDGPEHVGGEQDRVRRNVENAAVSRRFVAVPVLDHAAGKAHAADADAAAGSSARDRAHGHVAPSVPAVKPAGVLGHRVNHVEAPGYG